MWRKSLTCASDELIDASLRRIDDAIDESSRLDPHDRSSAGRHCVVNVQ
jgi:hypothetical protein